MDRDLERYLRQARRTAAHREAGSEREIRGLYREMLKELQDFMGETYAQYAQEDRLTYGMLQAAGYEARFLEEVEQRLNLAAPKAAEALRKLVEQTYEAAYTAMAQGVQRAAQGMDAGFPASIAITPEQIKAAVENPVSGLTLKDTLEKNRKEIVYEVKKAVGVGLMNGDRYTTMARRIAQQLDGDYKKAVRIARTEAGRVREAGSLAAAQSADRELRAGQSGLRLTKTWKTMKDEKVRPQRRRKGKGGWSSRMGHGANHMILEGQTVLADQEFDLMDGHTAPAPLNSGIAGHDINCRCYAAYELMTDAEYFERTGEHFPEAGGLTGVEGDDRMFMDTRIFRKFPSGEEVNAYFYSNRGYKRWAESLSVSEQQAINHYTGDKYQAINNYLRKTGDWRHVDGAKVEALVQEIDRAISRYELTDNITVQRGLMEDFIDRLTLENEVMNGLGELVGKTFVEKAYSSATAMRDNRVATVKPVILELQIPAGAGRGAYINRYAEDDKQDVEYEFLIRRNASFTIRKIRRDKESGKYYITAVMDVEH